MSDPELKEILRNIEGLLSELVKLNQPKKRGPQVRFDAPSVADVSAYVKEISGSINANTFVDYYQARGWKLNTGTPVKDWKACVRTWERNGFNKKPDSEQTGAIL